MGAALEVTMYYKNVIPLSEIVKQLGFLGYRIAVNNIEIFDDWLYTNHQVLEYNENTLNLNEILSDSKILLANFTVNEYLCGYHILKADDGIYEVCIWLDLSKLPFLDNDIINNATRTFYKKITDEIVSNIDCEKLLLIGIGIETMIAYDKALQNIVDNSKNILMWIFPKGREINIKPLFKKEEKDSFLIYSLEC